MLVRNCIDECFDGRSRPRRIHEIKKVILHRISRAKDRENPIPDKELTGPLVAAWFRDCRPYRPGVLTNGQMPYPLIIRTDGTVDQCCYLTDATPHAARWNLEGLGVALVGDFRKKPMTFEQKNTLIELCPLFVAMGMTLHGHSELEGGTLDANKICPGAYLNMDRLRTLAIAKIREKKLTKEKAQSRFENLGVLF